MRQILLVVAACCFLPVASHAQQSPQDCGCGDYVKIALGTTWYKSSTNQQRDLLHLLDVFESNLSELNKTIAGETSGTYAAIFNGHVSVSQDDYQKNYHEYRQHIEDKIKESYQNSTISQYPIELINGLDACHKSCATRATISCSALSSDPDTVIFSVKYRQPPDVANIPPKFTSDILKPANVRSVGNSAVNGTPVAVGVNEYRFDRSLHADEFTISAKIQPSADSCNAVVPAKAKQSTIPQFNSSCIFSDVGFSQEYSTTNKPPAGNPGYSKTYTCRDLKPGAKFLAVYSGKGEVNNPSKANWLGLWLTSPNQDTSEVQSAIVDYTNRDDFVISNNLVGTVPASGPNAGTATVTVELRQCQVDAGVTVQCSTKGNARLTIVTY